MFFITEIVLFCCYILTYYMYPPKFIVKYRRFRDKTDATENFKSNIVEYSNPPSFVELFICRDFVDHCWFLLKSTSCGYAEYLGYEMTTLFVGLSGNIDIINGWFIIKTIMALYYCMGIGFANAIRTFVGIKIGQRQLDTAKILAERGI